MTGALSLDSEDMKVDKRRLINFLPDPSIGEATGQELPEKARQTAFYAIASSSSAEAFKARDKALTGTPG